MGTLTYKGFEGTAEVDTDTQVLRGKLLFIGDLVTYEATTAADLQKEFEAAVEDYLETCAQVGKEPQRPFKGLFNVRTPPELHRLAALRAAKDGVFLNDVIIAALKIYLNQSTKTEDSTVACEVKGQMSMMVSPSQPPIWLVSGGAQRGN